MNADSVKFMYGTRSAYENTSVAENILYFLIDTREIYKGSTLVASKDIILIDNLPEVADALSNVLYVVSNSDGTSINILNNDRTKFIELASNGSNTVTADNMIELTNKIIDANSNEIKNLSISNFIENAITNTISEDNPSESKLVTEKAVSDAINNSGAMIDVSYDSSVDGEYATWTFTAIDGTTKVINTPKETFLQSASYDNSTKILTLLLNNNAAVEVDMSTLVPSSMSTEDVSVPIDKDITVELGTNGSVGGYKTGDTISAGTTVQQIITKLLAKQIPPTYTAPTISIANNGGPAAGSYEIGTSIDPKLKATFTKNDAGNLTNISISLGSTVLSSGTTSPLSMTNMTSFILDNTTSFSASASYEEGPIKNDNLGDPYSVGHITAGTKTSSNYTFTPYRMGCFYGVLETTSTEQVLTSNIIRGLNKTNKAYASGNLSQISASSVSDPKRIVIACPTGKIGVKKVIMPSAMNADCTNDFVKQSFTISVEGANGYAGVDYNIWIYEPAAITSDQTFTVTLG